MPSQSRHLDLIGQFSTDIQHHAGDQNVIADALICIESIESRLEYAALAANQENDAELKALLTRGTSFVFEKGIIPGHYMRHFHQNHLAIYYATLP